MSIGWLQLAWVAAGDVNFNFMDEALSVDGNWENIQGGKRAGKWEGGKKRMDVSSSGGWYASGKDARPADDRRKLSGRDATYADSQARISPASTAHMLSR